MITGVVVVVVDGVVGLEVVLVLLLVLLGEVVD